MVHRFITKGTFEERINEMIQNKKVLANMTVATSENWIGNLSNKELKNIFELGWFYLGLYQAQINVLLWFILINRKQQRPQLNESLCSIEVGPPGHDPGTPWLWVRCSNQLSYRPGITFGLFKGAKIMKLRICFIAIYFIDSDWYMLWFVSIDYQPYKEILQLLPAP